MTTNIIKDIQTVNTGLMKYSPAILIVLGVTGMISTVVMACKATPKAMDILQEEHEIQEENEENNSTSVQLAKDIKAVIPIYVPTVLMGTISIACIVGSYSINNKRMAVLATAYTISERTLHEYQKKVVDTFGAKKEERIRDEIKKDKVKQDPPKSNDLISPSEGNMLCYDSVLGGYFQSNINKIKKIENQLNRRMRSEMYISVNDFFEELGREQIKHGNNLGWNVDHEINITFSSIITEEDRTCLVIDYDICPRYDFRSLY